jgi:hypothetical protein
VGAQFQQQSAQAITERGIDLLGQDCISGILGWMRTRDMISSHSEISRLQPREKRAIHQAFFKIMTQTFNYRNDQAHDELRDNQDPAGGSIDRNLFPD